jgi:uncharacterized membrane protein
MERVALFCIIRMRGESRQQSAVRDRPCGQLVLLPPSTAALAPVSLGLFLWSAQAAAQEGVSVPSLDTGVVLTLHPIVVHFAIALTLFGLALDCAGSLRRQALWQYAGRVSFFAGVVAMGLAVVSGWIELQLPRPPSAFDAHLREVLFYHEYLGYGLFGFFLILAVARLQLRDRLPVLFVILAAVGIVGLTVQGYLGGEMVYRYGAGVRAVYLLSEAMAKSDGQKKAPE